MIISVKIIPRSKQEKIEQQTDGSYKVWVRAAPEEGKANKRLTEMLADYFDVSKSSVFIISGETSRNKKIEVKK